MRDSHQTDRNAPAAGVDFLNNARLTVGAPLRSNGEKSFRLSTDSSLNESSRDAFERNERKEDEQNHVSVTNLARGVKMIRQGHPPGHLDYVVKKVFPFAGFCHVNFQTCQLSVNAVENSNNQGKQCSGPKLSQSIKQRHA